MLIEVLNSFKVFRGYTSYIAVKILLFCEITYVYFLLQQGKFTGRIWRAGAPFNWNGTTVKLQAGRMWGITWRHLILALIQSPIHPFFHISPFLNNSRFALIECTSFFWQDWKDMVREEAETELVTVTSVRTTEDSCPRSQFFFLCCINQPRMTFELFTRDKKAV